MSTGVLVDDGCIKAFEDIKNGKTNRFAIFKIVDTKIVVEDIGNRDATYVDFLTKLKAVGGHCRFAIYDYEFRQQETASKLLFMNWSPDDASIREKMINAACTSKLTDALVGIQKYITITDDEEASQSNIEIILQ